MTLNDLGKFDTFDDVKSAYEESELVSGDYVTVDGTIYYWNAITVSWCLACPIEEDAPEETDLSSMTESSPTETDLSTGTEDTPREEDLSSVAEDEGRGNHDHDENITFENNLTVASDTRTRRLFADWATISGLLRSGTLRVDGILSAGSIVADSITNLDDVINGLVANMFIRKDRKDKTPYLVQFLAGLEYGLYAAGGKNGGKLHEGGLAEVGRLQVNGNSEFRGNLSSKDFISGFTAGKGWALRMKKYLNAAGAEESRSVLELDDLIVRGTMRVFEFIVNQMLGENDNRTFTGMMEVDHYDPETGKVYLDTHDGKLYNPFRKDDIVIVQQFNGMPTEEHNYYLTKQYELLITEASVGSMSDGEKRLDWVKFTNFTTTMEGAAEDIITKGDTFVRIDNLTDERRKGIIQIMTVGDDTPYMDIIFGKKTDPDNALKGRLGNLQGIYHHLFGWLEGFGELLTNLYAIGDFRLRQTGEDIDSKIEILKGSFSTSYKKLTYDITEEDNYLKNATFTEDMEYWQTGEDNINFLTVGDEAVILNRSTVVVKDSFALLEEYAGREMLHLCNDWVKQPGEHIRKPDTHKEYKRAADDTCDEYVEVPDTLYLSVKLLARTSGTLTIGMQGSTIDMGSLPYSVVAIEKSSDWQTLQWSGTWDGKGDFLLKYTGDLYISLLSLTDKPLDEYKKEISTAIEQTASNIRLLGTNINNLKGTVTNLGIDLDAAKERITLYANKVDNLEGTVTSLGIRIDAAEENITLYAKKTNELEGTVTDLGIRLDAAEGDITLYAKKIGNNETAISALQIKADSIISTVTSVQGDLEQAKATAAAASKAAMDKALEAIGDADDAWWKAYYAQQAADQAQGAADDAANSAGEANRAIDNLNKYVDGAFADGVIEESEAKAIEKYINTVNNTKSAVEATYNKLYANAYLSGTPKTNLLNAKVTLFGAISNLISSINIAISDGKTTVAEKRDVDSKFIAFNSAYASFNTAVEVANKSIQDTLKGYSDDAYGKAIVNATAIAQTDSAVSILAGRFTSDGRLVNTGGLLVTADKTELSNEIYDINGKLAKKAEVSTSVQYNPSTGKVTTNLNNS